MINDTTFPISLEKEYKISIDGKELKIKVMTKDTLLYDDDLFSFKYTKEYKVNKLEIEDGIEQIMLITAEGSGILIQKYASLNPTMMNEIMLTQITKGKLSNGYKMKRKDYKKTLRSGQKIDVNQAILSYKDDTNIYEVASVGGRDEGIIIITMISSEKFCEQGKNIIDLMWDSLIYK